MNMSTNRGCVATAITHAATRTSTQGRPARLQVEILEAAEPDRADHEHGRHEHDGERGQGLPVIVQAGRKRVRRGRGNRGSRRTRHAHEVSFVGRRARLDVEARESNRGPRDVEKAGRPAEPSERRQAPREHQNGRGHAEGNDVGQRIELDAERAGGAGQPRDAPVQHVENDREAHKRRGRRVTRRASRTRTHAYPQKRLPIVSRLGRR